MVKLSMTLWMMHQYTHSHYKDTGVLPNSVAGGKETAQGFYHEANGDFEYI
jgi:hypothetical protein